MLTAEDLQDVPIYGPLSSKQEAYLKCTSNLVIWGGAAAGGKTSNALLKTAICSMNDEHYRAGIVAYSKEMMKGAGSIFETARNSWKPFKYKGNQMLMTFEFPTGAYVKFSQLNHNRSAYYGQQVTHYVVDESQLCDESDVWFLTSRLRSKSKFKHQIHLTCNPLKNSFLCRWLMTAGYVDPDTGFPLDGMDGKETFMAQVAGEFVFTKTKAEMQEKYGKETAKYCQSVTFFSATVESNPYIRKHVPEYVSRLRNLTKVERDQLLYGNWLVSANDGGFIRREMAEEIKLSDIPIHLLNNCTRAWDLAGSRPKPDSPDHRQRDPDYSFGVKTTYDKKTGIFYIIDSVSIRDEASVVEDLIHRTAEGDSNSCVIGLPVDPGAAGKESYQGKSARLAAKGFKVMANKTRGSKLQRAEELILAFQQNRVRVVEGCFTDKEWEMIEGFTGEKHSPLHDDVVDSLADNLRMQIHGMIRPISVEVNKETKRRWKSLGGRTLL